MHDQGSTANPLVSEIICRAADKLGISLEIFDTYRAGKTQTRYVRNSIKDQDDRARVIKEAQGYRTRFGNLASLAEVADALGVSHNSICRMRDRTPQSSQSTGPVQSAPECVP